MVLPVLTNKTAPIVAPIYTTTTVNQVQTVEDDDHGSNSTVTIAVICSIVGLIIIGGSVAYYFMYKRYQLGRRANLGAASQTVVKSQAKEDDVSSCQGDNVDIAEEDYEE